MTAVQAIERLETALPELHEHSTPKATPHTVLFDPLTRDYNVQFASPGQWFHVVKHTDEHGVTWMQITAYGRFEQIPYSEVSNER